MKDKEKILKTVREKHRLPSKEGAIRYAADFLMKTVEVRRHGILQRVERK